MTTQQKTELDKIEAKILCLLFGSINIPEPTAIALRLAQINPNDYITKFENTVLPLMKNNGYIDGNLLKKVISISKYRDIINILSIPTYDFLLSDVTDSLLQKFIPGVIDNVL